MDIKRAIVTSGFSPIVSVTYPIPVELTLNSLGQVCEMSICLPSTKEIDSIRRGNTEDWKAIFHESIEGTFESGSHFTINVKMVKGFNHDAPRPSHFVVECLVSNMREEHVIRNDDSDDKRWIIRLSNVSLCRGDLMTKQLLSTSSSITMAECEDLINKHKETFPNCQQPQNENGNEGITGLLNHRCKHNKVAFRWNERDWELTDDKFGELRENGAKVNVPILSGSLSTTFDEKDTPESIVQTVSEVASLLSFALGRDIKPCVVILLTGDDINLVHEFALPVRPFNEKGCTVADNWEPYNIKRFIESSEEAFRKNKTEWERTLGLFSSGTSNKLLEIRLSVLNILLDRLTTQLIGQECLDLIDSSVPTVVKNPVFKFLLHLLVRVFVDLPYVWRTGG